MHVDEEVGDISVAGALDLGDVLKSGRGEIRKARVDEATVGFLTYGKHCVQHSYRCLDNEKKLNRFVYSSWHSICSYRSR